MKYSPEEIKKMLEGITQGEWGTKENGGKGELIGVTSTNSSWFIAEEVLERDARFIAAAPNIIRDLLAENERLSALAATHLADQELLVGQERKRVARECAEIAEKLRHQNWASESEDWVDGTMAVSNAIRTRYGVEG